MHDMRSPPHFPELASISESFLDLLQIEAGLTPLPHTHHLEVLVDPCRERSNVCILYWVGSSLLLEGYFALHSIEKGAGLAHVSELALSIWHSSQTLILVNLPDDTSTTAAVP